MNFWEWKIGNLGYYCAIFRNMSSTFEFSENVKLAFWVFTVRFLEYDFWGIGNFSVCSMISGM